MRQGFVKKAKFYQNARQAVIAEELPRLRVTMNIVAASRFVRRWNRRRDGGIAVFTGCACKCMHRHQRCAARSGARTLYIRGLR